MATSSAGECFVLSASDGERCALGSFCDSVCGASLHRVLFSLSDVESDKKNGVWIMASVQRWVKLAS